MYLYAIVDDPSVDLAGVLGLGDVPVKGLPLGSLLGVISEHDQLTLNSTDADSLWRHQEVLDAVMRQSTVAPVRFATVAPDEDGLRRLVAPHLERLQPRLDALKGKCELAVRATVRGAADASSPPSPSEPNSGLESGRNYLHRRLSESPCPPLADAAGRLGQVNEFLGRLSVASTAAPVVAATLRASYLVEFDKVGQFADVVASLDRRQPDLQLSLTGPWPPFSFVDTGRLPADDAHE